jgi:predicted nucleic acid-binding protein
VKDWLDFPATWIPEAGVRHRDLVDGMMSQVSSPRLITDVHLAALAIEHGLTLCSTDGDFARFRGLKWQNPLRV